MQQTENNQDTNYYAHRRLIRDTTPDRTRRALRHRGHPANQTVRAAVAIIVAAALLLAGLMLGRATAEGFDHDPVFERKVTDCADYIGTCNFRLQDGRAYEAARILVTASREAGNGWGWELPAAIARYETAKNFNINSHNERTKCYGLLQVRYKTSVHGAEMDALGLKRTDPYDTVLYGCMMLAKSQREGKSLAAALVPWGAGIKGRVPAIIKEYQNIKELYRR